MIASAVSPQSVEPLNKAIQRVLLKSYGQYRNGPKLLAKAARSTPRAAENWLDGSCTPNAEKLVNLMAECDELAEEILRRVGRSNCSP